VENGERVHSANGKQPMAMLFVHSYFIRAFVAYFKNDGLKMEMWGVGFRL